MSPLLGACGPKAAATPAAGGVPTGQNLKFWWWGETEAPGLQKWVDETAALYKTKSGNTIESTLMDTLVVISEFQTASAANAAPDTIFLWNGIYHMETVWLGYLDPLEDFFSWRGDRRHPAHQAVGLRGQDLPPGVVCRRPAVPVKQGHVRQGRPGRKHGPQDLGRPAQWLRQAQDGRTDGACSGSTSAIPRTAWID